MAKLDRPLFGTWATGCVARALNFRHTANPPDLPGEAEISWGTVAGLPHMTVGPSAAQIEQRHRYRSAVDAWNLLTDEEQDYYRSNRPSNLSGFSFFLRLQFFPTYSYFGYAVFGVNWFMMAPAKYPPEEADYPLHFPAGSDEFPILQDGSDPTQAWLANRLLAMITACQEFIVARE